MTIGLLGERGKITYPVIWFACVDPTHIVCLGQV